MCCSCCCVYCVVMQNVICKSVNGMRSLTPNIPSASYMVGFDTKTIEGVDTLFRSWAGAGRGYHDRPVQGRL